MKKEEIKDFKKLLRKAKYTVYTKVNHVARSGMMRAISSYVIVNNKPVCIDWEIEKITSYKQNNTHDGLTVHGCGMDMGFSLVYNLSSVLYPKGFKSHRRNAINGMKPGDNGYEWDQDGGYRITQKWL